MTNVPQHYKARTSPAPNRMHPDPNTYAQLPHDLRQAYALNEQFSRQYEDLAVVSNKVNEQHPFSNKQTLLN